MGLTASRKVRERSRKLYTQLASKIPTASAEPLVIRCVTCVRLFGDSPKPLQNRPDLQSCRFAIAGKLHMSVSRAHTHLPQTVPK